MPVLRHHTVPLFFLCSVLIAASAAMFFLLTAFVAPIPEYPESKLRAHISQAEVKQSTLNTSSPTPTPKPTAVYPPKGYTCVNVPILMYHHVEPMSLAKAAGHGALTVDASIFASHMQYLQENGYTPIQLHDLASHFDTRKALPTKPIVLTFDDGYSDFYTYALPVLTAKQFSSDLFVSTGLVENPGYLTWSQIQEAQQKNVSIDHHTWSHAKMSQTSEEFFSRELDTATQQLTDHGYGPVTVFAYPYGTYTNRAISEVSKRGFSIAVTTNPGRIQCKEDRMLLRRIRIGNQSLKSYGL